MSIENNITPQNSVSQNQEQATADNYTKDNEDCTSTFDEALNNSGQANEKPNNTGSDEALNNSGQANEKPDTTGSDEALNNSGQADEKPNNTGSDEALNNDGKKEENIITTSNDDKTGQNEEEMGSIAFSNSPILKTLESLLAIRDTEVGEATLMQFLEIHEAKLKAQSEADAKRNGEFAFLKRFYYQVMGNNEEAEKYAPLKVEQKVEIFNKESFESALNDSIKNYKLDNFINCILQYYIGDNLKQEYASVIASNNSEINEYESNSLIEKLNSSDEVYLSDFISYYYSQALIPQAESYLSKGPFPNVEKSELKDGIDFKQLSTEDIVYSVGYNIVSIPLTLFVLCHEHYDHIVDTLNIDMIKGKLEASENDIREAIDGGHLDISCFTPEELESAGINIADYTV